MAFNVNYLAGTFNGLIPLNIDGWQKANGQFADRYIGGQPVNDTKLRYSTKMFTSNLFEAYWTVRSFKIDFRILLVDFGDPLAAYMLGGGSTSTIIGATAGLAAASNSIGGNSLSAKGYTKMYHRNYKTVLKNSKNKKTLEPDEKADPNPLEGFIFKPNEGTLVSPGPVHIFTSKQKNLSIKIDFSDILYRNNLYYPKITISGRTTSFSFEVGPNFGAGASLHYIYFMGSMIPIGVKSFSTNPTSIPIVIFNCTIEPGERCCDRFYWDGKDKEREEDCDSCNDNISTDPSSTDEALEKEGVYAKPETVTGGTTK